MLLTCVEPGPAVFPETCIRHAVETGGHPLCICHAVERSNYPFCKEGFERIIDINTGLRTSSFLRSMSETEEQSKSNPRVQPCVAHHPSCRWLAVTTNRAGHLAAGVRSFPHEMSWIVQARQSCNPSSKQPPPLIFSVTLGPGVSLLRGATMTGNGTVDET